jgi:hypothetical protein
MPERKRYTFWIGDALCRGLKAVKKRDDISESEQIRQALHDWLLRKGALTPPLVDNGVRARSHRRR